MEVSKFDNEVNAIINAIHFGDINPLTKDQLKNLPNGKNFIIASDVIWHSESSHVSGGWTLGLCVKHEFSEKHDAVIFTNLSQPEDNPDGKSWMYMNQITDNNVDEPWDNVWEKWKMYPIDKFK